MSAVFCLLTLLGSERFGVATSSSLSHSSMLSSSDFLDFPMLFDDFDVPGVPDELRRDREWKNSLAATGVFNENSSFSHSASNCLSSSL